MVTEIAGDQIDNQAPVNSFRAYVISTDNVFSSHYYRYIFQRSNKC